MLITESMVILTLIDPQTQTPLQQWNFPEQGIIRIGRLSDNDLVFGDCLEISRHHLELHQINSTDWRLINKGTNGTFLNGKLTSEALIKDNSLIQLAKEGPTLKFQIQAVSIAPQKPPQIQPQPVKVCTHQDNPSNNLFCIHCGKPIVETEVFVLHYQILKTLGRGGMGTTYIAWDQMGKTTGKPLLLVLKEMNADMAQIAKARELFDREARILKSLNHPGIPQYYDFFLENEKKYLAMGLIHGQNLEEKIHKQGPVTPPQAIKWMIQLCDILDYLHSLKPPLVHRDVKPANLMLRNLDHQIILLDFGAVKEVGTAPGTRIGAEGYSAPEQDRGQPCPQSDIYAIGPTLIFLLTGEAPLKYFLPKGNVYRFDVSKIPTITPQLGKIIEKASDPKVSERYSNAQELAKALASCL